MDLSTLSVHLVREFNNDKLQKEHEVISTKPLINGEATIEGELSAPIETKILVKSGDETILSATTVLSPRDLISVAILDHLGPFPHDQIAFVGSSQQVLDIKVSSQFWVISHLSIWIYL